MGKFVLLLLSLGLVGNSCDFAYAEEKKKNLIPEFRDKLDDKRADLLMVLATDVMFVRHFSADRLSKLKELEINVSLQPFNEKQKAVLAIRKQEMDECMKEAAISQANFFTAYEQLDSAKYDVSDYKALQEYAKKNVSKFQKKDIMYPQELKSYEESRPKGFTFRSICIDDGMGAKLKEKPEFVSPNTTMKK